MAKNNKYEIDYFDSDEERKPKKRKPGKSNGGKIFLAVSAAVLVTALVVFTIVLMSNRQTSVRIVDFGTAVKGVKVEGVDISGMTKPQALKATENIEQSKLGEVKFTLVVNNQKHQYGSGDFSVVSDYQQIINKAMDFGHTGNFDQRQADTKKAASEGKNFTITLSVDDKTFKASLNKIKASLDVAAKDPTAAFMPWGYTLNADGTATAYEPDKNQLITDTASGKAITYPDKLARLGTNEMPPSIRYQYYHTKKYEDYIPAAANIARFYYTPEVTGITTDVNSIADQIKQELSSGNYKEISVPTQVTKPTGNLDQIKQQTHLISSWTSSYQSHPNQDRTWNVAKMSGIICGQILQPGAQWSINDTAGPRYTNNGWKKAPGIVDGGYQDQPGGGVCQISSTLYNATIRCGLTKDNIVSQHHSIKSGYIPAGLDATISTGSPDLKITNPYNTPLYIVSFPNPETKSVTVEMYGAPVIDPSTGKEVIYNYDSSILGSYGNAPTDVKYYNQTVLPDGTAIDPGTEKRYADMQTGMKIQTVKHYLSLDGNDYKHEDFETVIIKPINGSVYCNYPDPATVPPSSSPSPTTSPTTTTSTSPATNMWQGSYPY